MSEIWFSALGKPLAPGERREIDAYLSGLGLEVSTVHAVSSWSEARAICMKPARDWWQAEEAERARLETRAHLDPADREWLALNERLLQAAEQAAAKSACEDAALVRAAAGAASYAAYQWRLARAAGASGDHAFLHKYALYCGGRWPLGVYDGRFALF